MRNCNDPKHRSKSRNRQGKKRKLTSRVVSTVFETLETVGQDVGNGLAIDLGQVVQVGKDSAHGVMEVVWCGCECGYKKVKVEVAVRKRKLRLRKGW